MSRSSKLDPLDRFRWRIYVAQGGDTFLRAGFSECSSPGVTITYKEYLEGGGHMTPRLIHDKASFKPITLRRGVVAKPSVDDFSRWVGDAYKVFQGDPKAKQYRVDIVIDHLDRNASVAKRYTLHNCVPTFYETGSDFNSTDDAGVSLETLTIQYEGFTEETIANGGTVIDRIRSLF
jgi:phage tail-like protein